MTVYPIIFIVSWKVLIEFERLSIISSWEQNLSSISFSNYSLSFWNSFIAFFWNSSTYLCCIFSYRFVSSLNLPRVRLLSVLSSSIFFPSLYFSSSSACRMSFSRSVRVWHSSSNCDYRLVRSSLVA
jgi:hypothetical protein